MTVDLQIEGADKFAKLAKAARQVGDKELRKELYAGINRSVKPLTAAVKESTPHFLPRRYAIELAKSLKVKTRRRAGRDPAIYLYATAKTKKKVERDLSSLNRGRLRHPLFGDRRHWFNQPVTPKWWDDPLSQNADVVREELVGVLDDIAVRLAKKL